jgi:hypothetical protein
MKRVTKIRMMLGTWPEVSREDSLRPGEYICGQRVWHRVRGRIQYTTARAISPAHGLRVLYGLSLGRITDFEVSNVE